MPPKIEHYEFGAIKIDGETYRSDVIILPDRVVPDWWRKEGHGLSMDDLKEALAVNPRVLIVGTGWSGAMTVADETRWELQSIGVELIAEPTEAAVETYGRLAEEGDVAAGLHLTC